MKLSQGTVKEFLEEKHDLYNRPDFINSDPISIPHSLDSKEDIEIAGFLVATIAWGQRTTIIDNGHRLMNIMGSNPYDFIMSNSFHNGDNQGIKDFKHRTFNGEDCGFFLDSLKNIYTNHGGLERVFTDFFTDYDGNGQKAISAFKDLFFSIPFPKRTRKHVADPLKNSSAKRINMYLRWMVRNDGRGVDFGLWKGIDPANLFLPLDAHTGNVSRKLGILKRKQNDWKAVTEVTQNLKTLDPLDPVKYDYSLFGLGVFEKF